MSDAPVTPWERSKNRHSMRDFARRLWWALDQSKEPGGEEQGRFRSLRLCGMSAIPGRGTVELHRKDGRAAAVGAVSCGSTWGCPVCAARVRDKRRHELQELVSRGVEQGYRWVFITGTLKHQRGQSVAQQRAALQAGWKALTNGKQAQERRESGAVAGTIRAIEFTLEGPAGPHGHVHALALVAPKLRVKDGGAWREAESAEEDDRALSDAMEAMGERWKSWAERNMDGLRPDDAHGWKWELAESAKDAGNYVAKVVDGDGWTVAHELTRSDVKRGKGGQSPMELLAHAVADVQEHGDMTRFMRFSEFVLATKGMRAIVVSRSLTDVLGKVDARSDEELAQEPEVLGDGWELVAVITVQEWRDLVWEHGVGTILDAVVRCGKGWRADLPRAGPKKRAA